VGHALEAALRAGVQWRDFWGLTPHAVRTIVRAYNEHWNTVTELTMANAYHGAALSLSDPKKFPRSFGDWYGKPSKERPAKAQSEREIAAAFLSWALKAAPKEEAN
jgi:hypothetical protein